MYDHLNLIVISVSEDAVSGHIQLLIPGETACFACAPPLVCVLLSFCSVMTEIFILKQVHLALSLFYLLSCSMPLSYLPFLFSFSVIPC